MRKADIKHASSFRTDASRAAPVRERRCLRSYWLSNRTTTSVSGRCLTGTVQMPSPLSNALVRRSAYTLVEMLIASILTATLMATVWNLTTLYSGFLTAGRTQAEEQQLARSLIDIISTDLQAVTLGQVSNSTNNAAASMPVSEMISPPGLESALSSASEESELESTSLELRGLFGLDGSGRVLPTFDIQGRAHQLTLTASDVEPGVEILPFDEETGTLTLDESLTPDASTLASEPDLLPGPPLAPEYRRIVYEFVPPRLQEEAGAEGEGILLPGLYRYEIPIEHLNLLTLDAEARGSEAPPELHNVSDLIQFLTEQGVTSLRQEHVPEVVGCEFEYLTDFGWGSTWTPHDDGRTLQAIRIRLRLLSPDEHAELMTALGVSDEDVLTEDASSAERLPTSEDPLELPVDFAAEQDPFDQFEPRTFTWIMLMNMPKRLTLGESEGLSFGQDGGFRPSAAAGDQP